jgi:predicted nucleic acid-binding protein
VKLKIYLDNCCYNRPFDDPTIGENFKEANAKIFIQSLIKLGELELVYSPISLEEINASKFEDSKTEILEFINRYAKYYINADIHPELVTITSDIMRSGVKLKDASHVACAIVSESDYMITTDKRLLRYKDNRIKIINPIDFTEIWRNED